MFEAERLVNKCSVILNPIFLYLLDAISNFCLLRHATMMIFISLVYNIMCMCVYIGACVCVEGQMKNTFVN